MIHTAFCKPKTVQGHHSFHPTTEVTDNGANASPETSEVTSKICTCLFPLRFQLGCSWASPAPSRSMNPTMCPFSEEGHHTVTHGPSKAGQELAGGAYHNLPALWWSLRAFSQICALCTQNTMFCTTFRIRSFQDFFFLKKKKPQNQHVMIANSVNFYRWENCVRQEVEAPVHQLQWALRRSGFPELIQNLVWAWLAGRLQTLINAIRGEWVNKSKASFWIIVYLFIIIASTG